MERIYRGCMTKNADGTNRIIGAGEGCLVATAQCFWKYPEDVKNSGVKTRSQHIKQPTVSIKEYDDYFKKIKRIIRWITVPDSEV